MTRVVWIVYDLARATDTAREFSDKFAAAAYRDRQARETGARWVVRFRIKGGEPIEGVTA